MADTRLRPAGFSPAEAARLLSISRSTLYTLIARDELHVVKIGTRTIVPATEIDRLLDVSADGQPLDAA